MALVGIVILSSNYINLKIDKAYSYMNDLLLESELSVFDINEEVDNLEGDSTSSLNNKENENIESVIDRDEKYYVGRLEIPKIKLSKGFTDINSPYNTVSKNLEVVKGSDYPDVENGNFIIAAHSGNSYLAYFKNLYKLELGDISEITYNRVKYTYKIVKIYYQEKNGTIAIYRDPNKTTLTLVTCTKDSSTKQTIYILELSYKENL